MCQSRFKFRSLLILSSLILMSAFMVKFALGQELVAQEMFARFVGVVIAIVLIVTGNLLPKFAHPLDTASEVPVTNMAFERFAGLAFVLAGIVGAVGWIVLKPNDAALLFAIAGLSASTAAILYGISKWNSLGKQNLVRLFTFRLALRQSPFMIIHAILWVCILFLLDRVFGDAAVQWAIIAFALFNSALSFWFANLGKNTNRT